jgi:propionate CoA-transferase
MLFSGELDEENVMCDIAADDDEDALLINVSIGGGLTAPELVVPASLGRQLSATSGDDNTGVIPALLSRLAVLETGADGKCEAVVLGLDSSSPIPLPRRVLSFVPPPATSSFAGDALSFPKLTSAEAVAKTIADCASVTISGFNGSTHPELLTLALAARFARETRPRDLTLLVGIGQGDRRGRGLDALAQRGLLRRLIFSHLGTCPLLQSFVRDGLVEAFNLPLGVFSQLLRCAPHPYVSRVGLNTDHDPRTRGCAANDRSLPGTVGVAPVVEPAFCDGGGGDTGGGDAGGGDGGDNSKGSGKLLRYLPLAPDVALLRGTVADERGNISMEDEPVLADVLAQANNVRGRGGRVYFQVLRLRRVSEGEPPLERVDVPGCLVDGIVLAPPDMHWQTFASPDTNRLFTPNTTGGEGNRGVATKWPALAAGSWRRVVASRAAIELRAGETVNLGLGCPEKVAQVLDECGQLAGITLTTEAGTVGGLPQSGLNFGCATHPDMVCSTATMFDCYDGGMLDVTVLGMGEIDRGNVNVGRFPNGKLTGVGGFPHIALAAKRLVVFAGRHCAAGKARKFVERVESVSVSLKELRAPRVLVVTERCVLEAYSTQEGQKSGEGWRLLEVAKGEDVKAVLASIPWDVRYNEGRGAPSEVPMMPAAVFAAPFRGVAVVRETEGGGGEEKVVEADRSKHDAEETVATAVRDVAAATTNAWEEG